MFMPFLLYVHFERYVVVAVSFMLFCVHARALVSLHGCRPTCLPARMKGTYS